MIDVIANFLTGFVELISGALNGTVDAITGLSSK